jgi:NAD(P)-dependent dehydrogenase (short-subunit alcohol dehydrogenase family)
MDEIDLSGQVGLVTGGGAGIGQGVAVGLARRGATVIIADIDADRAGHTAKLIGDGGGEALPLTTDVMDTAQVEAAVRAAEERYGRLDVLVNNAGGVRARRFLEQSERSWRRHVDINLTSMLAATWHAAHLMVRGGRGGSIVNVASIEASRAAPMYSVYAACKAGMVNFTRTLAVELGEHGIRVNCIAPDHTRTPGLSGVRTGQDDPDALRVRPPEERAAVERYIPLGREGVVEECADVVAFLCSPLSRYVTGANLPVDGGTWASSGWVRQGDGWGLYGG